MLIIGYAGDVHLIHTLKMDYVSTIFASTLAKLINVWDVSLAISLAERVNVYASNWTPIVNYFLTTPPFAKLVLIDTILMIYGIAKVYLSNVTSMTSTLGIAYPVTLVLPYRMDNAFNKVCAKYARNNQQQTSANASNVQHGTPWTH